jgi:L-asparaginase II
VVDKTLLHCECSGKHAGMLAVCVHRDYPIDTYMEPSHPLQAHIRQYIARATHVPKEELVAAVDGCGLPTYAAPLQALATAYATLAAPGSTWEATEARALIRLREAMMAHPELIGGEGEIDTEIMRLSEGRILAKLGAEGLLCMAVPDHGIGIAIKEESGSTRSLGPAAVRVLQQLALLDDRTLDALRDRYWTAVRSFVGEEVGRIRAGFELERH